MKKTIISITLLISIILCGCSATSMLRSVTNYAQSKSTPNPVSTIVPSAENDIEVSPSPTTKIAEPTSSTAVASSKEKKSSSSKEAETASSTSSPKVAIESTPVSTSTPVPTSKVVATTAPKVSSIKATPTPTVVPTITPTPTPTVVPTPTPTPTPTQTIVSTYSAKTTSDTSNAGLIWNYFIGIYNNPYAVAGILGNIMQESSCIPTIVPWKDDSSSYGLCQWCGVRKEMLKAYADSRGIDVSNLYLQLDFIVKEMNESYSSLVSTLLNSTDATDAASQFCAKYEQAASFANCGTFARQFLEKYAKD